MSETVAPARAQRAFVLDDEPKISALICKILRAANIAARQFETPLAFLMELRTCRPDLIVLDLALGNSDAVDVIRKLEILKYDGRVLLISGRHRESLLEVEKIGRAHGLRMLPSLQKPFRLEDLSARLQAIANLQLPEPAHVPSAVDRPPLAQVSLEEALRSNWLEMWYQPKIDLKSLTICGAEALIRARHHTKGVIQPIDLLPPSGDPLYQPLSQFVLRRAMQDWATFAEQGQFIKLSVNIPASILNAPGFVGLVRNMLPSVPEFPGLLIELTEDEIIRDPQWVFEIATQLKLCRTWLSIDDFGTAYASLSRIKDLPFVELKLDRSFVSECASNKLKNALCQTVLDLAHRVGASLCAEGVETEDDLRCLMDLGFDTAQGFLFAKPMPTKDFIEFVQANKNNEEWCARFAGATVAPLRTTA
jgi:EAL domain-containing protein (putative c-di-GMP-specific phosphodiesterase class I)/ActR/RegA family two-component response regulator